MKKLIVAVFLVPLIFSSKEIRAQSQVIKINFLSLIVKTLNVSYEKVLETDNSIQLGVFFTGASIGDTKLTGFGITPEYRFYLSETESPEGVYVAPFLRYTNFDMMDFIVFTDLFLIITTNLSILKILVNKKTG